MKKLKKPKITQVVPHSPQYLTLVGACIYTSKSLEEIEQAIQEGFLKWCIARDGSKSLRVDDLDEYMHSGRGLNRLLNSCARRKGQKNDEQQS